MRICRCAVDGRVVFGIVEDDLVRVLRDSPLAGPPRASGEVLALSQVKLLPPVVPPNLLAIGLNYREHAVESGAALPDHPLLFIKATTSVIADGEPIVLPAAAPAEVDYEAELAVVIGRTASKVRAADALDYVFGYTCANDVSARDCQKRRDLQWARAKSFDSFCPLGPWIDTDLDPGNLRICSRLNGQTMQASTTADLIFDVPALIEHLSENITLLPGTVILTGTPPGVGMARKPPRFLRPGDLIEVEIAGLGILANPVMADR